MHWRGRGDGAHPPQAAPASLMSMRPPNAPVQRRAAASTATRQSFLMEHRLPLALGQSRLLRGCPRILARSPATHRPGPHHVAPQRQKHNPLRGFVDVSTRGVRQPSPAGITFANGRKACVGRGRIEDHRGAGAGTGLTFVGRTIPAVVFEGPSSGHSRCTAVSASQLCS